MLRKFANPRLIVLVLLLPFLSARGQAQVCANSGRDGPGGTLSGVINTYYPGTANASAGATSISIGSSTGSLTPIASGDLLLVIQMQDAAINSSNSDSYGDGFSGSPASGSTAVNNSGVYEYVVATSAAGASVSIRGAGAGNGLVNSYTNAAAGGSQGQRRFQVIRVPQYSSATLGSGLTALTWNGTTGGILVIDVAGNLALGSATVNLSGMGFRGGGVRQLNGGSGGTDTDYVNLASNAFHASKGEGIAGTPRYIFNGTSVVDTGVEGYPNGSFARGAPGNAGGGGTDSEVSTNQMNSGGGGGANWGAGGQGGRTWSANQDRGGHGGAGFNTASASRMIMGGGGGAGTRNNSSGTMSSGAAGGGIVMIRAGTFSGSATITVNGADGIDAENDGGGGAGAGGSVLVVANSGGLGSLTINARGGVGGDAWITEPANGSPGARHGPGGGGGGGFIATNGSATTNVTGGTNGRTTTSLDAYGATAGSNGSVQSILASDVPGAGSGAQCVPVLTVTKTTSTPSVTNTTSGTTGTYSITVANAANRSSATNLNISDALPSGFTYSSTVSVTLNGGATRPSTTNPSAGATNPSWGVFTIPGGGSVVLTFNVAIASSVTNGTYQNPATATYTDPARTVANGTTTSSYNSGSSNAEDVTVSSVDLTIAKSHTGNFQQGQTGATYSITVTNSGNIASSGLVTVTDTLPASLTATAISGTGWSCVLGTLTCTRSDALAGGASYPAITLTVNVASTAPSSVTNSATVSGGNEANTSNNTDTDPTTVTQMPDLTVNKSHSGNFTLGQTGATYSIVVTNSGSATTSGTVTMTDTLPAGLTATGISGSGWSCVLATLTCTRSTTRGPGNSFQTITVTVNVAANAPPIVTNTATVSGGGEINTSNNTDNDPTTIVQPDLTIAKSHSGNFTQGQTGAQYSITVTNAGSASTNGTTVTVTDTLPAGLTATAISGTGWSCVLGTLTCTRTTVLTAGNSYPAITLTVNVANNAAASVTNSVTVSGGGQIYTANDTATDPTTINQMPDMTVAKSHTGNFTQGQVGATYSITVSNSGFAATTAGVSVTDTLPASLTATAISGTGWSCVLGTLTCTRSDVLANGASYPVITLTVNVSPTAPASVTNSVTVSGGGQTNTSNDTATDPTTINSGVPNITLVKIVNPTGTQIPGTDLVYTVTYTNEGSAAAQSFIIIDPNPANVDPLERVFHNVDFKIGSMTSTPGTSGLVATFSYSNNGGTTWTYTPVSGGGGAPAGYDRNVTNIRWSFAGNLSQTSPNNTGSVGFTARIR